MDRNHFENLKSKIQNSVRDTIDALNNADLNRFKDLVSASITNGISPVEGQGRFIKYSDSYQSAIKKNRYKEFNKKLRPVNLTLSGKMMKSLYVKKTEEGFIIGFRDELAFIHTVLGAGKVKAIRKLLPQEGEYFSRTITSFLTKVVSESWMNEFKKNFDEL